MYSIAQKCFAAPVLYSAAAFFSTHCDLHIRQYSVCVLCGVGALVSYITSTHIYIHI